MSTFAELAAKGQGVGVAFLLEGSVDLFVSTPYLYSTHDGLFGGSTAYDARLIGLGDLQRGFGVDGTVAASSVSVKLDNTDGALDYLLTSTSVIFKVRWRLKMVLYDANNPSDLATKVMGVFVNLDNPVRDGTTLTLSLADDSFGQAAELAIPPTAGEAFAGALDAATTEPPVPIAFGAQGVPAMPKPYAATDTTIKLILTATTDTSDAGADEVTSLTLRMKSANTIIRFGGPGVLEQDSWDIASQGYVNGEVLSLWGLDKTASLAKDGRTWRVLYVNLYVDNLIDYLQKKGFIPSIPDGWADLFLKSMGVAWFNADVLPQIEFTANGPRFASRTYTQTGLAQTVRAPDIAYDLLRYYSRGLDSSQVDQTSFARVTAAAPMFFFNASVYFTNFTATPVKRVSNGGALGRQTKPALSVSAQGLLRRALTDLCQGGLFDIVTNWEGKFTAHLLANDFSLQTTTPTVVDETLMANMSDRIPSVGERWAPYNRVIFQSNGRIVDNETAITAWGQILPRTINDSVVDIFEALSGTDFGIGTFGGIGTLESVIRPVITFDYPLEALNWELGDFIAVTWSRGASGLTVWDGAAFRVESLTVHPTRGSVTVQAVWIQDLRDELPYLLDDETLLVRSKGALSGSALFDGSNTVEFDGTINLTTMGVEVGDMLVLQSSAEASDEFTFNSAYRITAIPSTVTVEVTGPSGVPALSGADVPNAEWSIVRGATTYHDATSDPTNYPDGSTMYGKLSESGTFSDSSTANKMKNG